MDDTYKNFVLPEKLDELVAWVVKTHMNPDDPICKRAALGGTLHLVIIQLAILEELRALNKNLRGLK